MKTDNYLTLCLEQAARSPLHFRHGCVVVRGGKIIGQGYNDYRSGFEGAVLKHGRIAQGKLDGPALAHLKGRSRKPKGEMAANLQQHVKADPKTTLEAGCAAHVPFTMHSEMMAIHSALTASSTLSSVAPSCQKPRFKLPDNTKHHARVHCATLAAYVDAVCVPSPGSGSSTVQQCGFEPGTSGVEAALSSTEQQQPPASGAADGWGRACAECVADVSSERRASGVSSGAEWRETPSEPESHAPEPYSERSWSAARCATTPALLPGICV